MVNDFKAGGYRLDMTETLRSTLGARGDADLLRVVGTLRRSGPLGLDDLFDELAAWPVQRIERAVVAAWGENLISIDLRDQLVAL